MIGSLKNSYYTVSFKTCILGMLSLIYYYQYQLKLLAICGLDYE